MAKESDIEKYTRRRVAEAGGRMLKFVSPGLRGVPDDIVVWPGGEVHFLEFKRPGEKPKPEQENLFRELAGLGANVTVVDSIQSSDTYVQSR